MSEVKFLILTSAAFHIYFLQKPYSSIPCHCNHHHHHHCPELSFQSGFLLNHSASSCILCNHFLSWPSNTSVSRRMALWGLFRYSTVLLLLN